MQNPSMFRVLVVDDEPGVRDSTAMFLRAEGYEVAVAEHGFDALLQLRSGPLPHIIISDLNMPHMSGFEFLSVLRRRFPQIAVIATSGAYHTDDLIPGGIIADAFYPKGNSVAEFLRIVEEMAHLSPSECEEIHQRRSAPVWIPRNGKDSNGVPFIVLTCSDCLRSFPLSVLREDIQEIQETPCIFCESPVRYVIDFSVAVSSLLREKKDAASAAAQPNTTKP